MAGAPEREEGVSSFPNPPFLFYKHYTDENVKAGLAPKPPRPVEGAYHVFGAPFNTEEAMIRPLETQGIKRLYPSPDYDKKAELKKLNRSILVCFLELLDILISNPATPARNQKISDLSVLFINMHHLINEFRPHQARETLRVIMERQRRHREDMIVQVQKTTGAARVILGECSERLTQILGALPPTTEAGGGALREREGEEAMDVSHPPVVGGARQVAGGYIEVGQSLVDMQEAELSKMIDSLLSGST